MKSSEVVVRGLVLWMVLAVGACIASTHAQQPASLIAPSADAEQILEPLRSKGGLPALGGAIFTRETIEWIGVVGVRAIGHEEKATVNDLWHLGSCTKSMTGTLIAQMVEQGDLKESMTMAEALPALAKGMNEKYREVTLSQLLTMTAAVPGDISRDGLWARLWKQNGTVVDQRADLTKTVLGWSPNNVPGKQFEYSNASFAIAGHIAEVKAGKAWEDLMQERIFRPAGITSAACGAPGSPNTEGKIDQPRGHRVKQRGSKDLLAVEPTPGGADNPPAIGPAGRVHMTMGDWSRYLMQHLRRGEPSATGEPAIMKRAAFDMAQIPPAGREYAWGWGTASRPWGGEVLTHNGSNTMWYCVTWIAPEKGFGVLVVTNAALPDTSKVCDEVAAALIEKWTKKGK